MDLLHALLFEPVGDLDDRHALGAGAGGDANGVGHVIGVAVGDDHLGRLDVIGARHRRRVVGLEEGVDQDRVSPSLSSKHEWP